MELEKLIKDCDDCSLSRGCGGVGLIWRKSIAASCIPIDSDRFCGIQLEMEECLLSILCVYLPSSDYTFDEFSDYTNDLECLIHALQPHGPVIISR